MDNNWILDFNNGIILQFGYMHTSTTYGDITFPTSFLSYRRATTTKFTTSTSVTTATAQWVTAVQNQTITGMRIICGAKDSAAAWIAIGY